MMHRYKVCASFPILQNKKIGDELTVFTYAHIREDAFDLYGFLDRKDLELFEMLLSVSGIGPKTAIGVFSIGTGSSIVSAIMTADVSFFSQVPRLGKKNAQKIIIELKAKVGGMGELDLSQGNDSGDIISALKSFGFLEKEAEQALMAVKEAGKTTEEKIKLALKYLGK